MPLTPVEIRHVQLRRTWLRGYRRSIVDRLLSDIADSFEEVWRERADMADRLEELEAETAKQRELETLLRATLVSAQQAAEDVKEHARREADLILQEAHAESRRVSRTAFVERERLEAEIGGIRARLRSALEAVAEPHEETESLPQHAQVEELSETGFRRLAG